MVIFCCAGAPPPVAASRLKPVDVLLEQFLTGLRVGVEKIDGDRLTLRLARGFLHGRTCRAPPNALRQACGGPGDARQLAKLANPGRADAAFLHEDSSGELVRRQPQRLAGEWPEGREHSSHLTEQRQALQAKA